MRAWLAKIAGTIKLGPFGWKSTVFVVLFLAIVGFDFLFPKRMGFELARTAWWIDRGLGIAFSQLKVSPVTALVWSGLREFPAELRHLAANRQYLPAQEFMARRDLGWTLSGKDAAWAQVWIYGMYRQGYLAYAYLLPQNFRVRFNDEEAEQEVGDAVTGVRENFHKREEAGFDLSKQLADAENEVIEARLNWGATMLGASNLGSRIATQEISRSSNFFQGPEGQEMLRRAKIWFSRSGLRFAPPAANCRDYPAVVEDVLKGRLGKIRNCLGKNLANPISSGEWRLFLWCARRNYIRPSSEGTSTREEGIALVERCANRDRE